ncbi:MAG: tetratricopeptide repeat protein [Fimbriimonadales bacterium]|nr:tetratricopeptide repeat protein [Fimbriimonadales bacterium]
MKRITTAVVAAVCLWTVMQVSGVAQEPPKSEPESPLPAHQDAPAPEPHAELKALVEAARELVNEGKHQEALQKAEELLQQAQAKGDKVGVAQAHRLRAWALQKLNRLDEAAKAWEHSYALWQEVGDGAFMVEALLGRAFCLWRTDKATAEGLIEQALALAKMEAEAERLLVMAAVLYNAGVDWHHQSELALVQQLWGRALDIYSRLAPNSLEVARVLNNLGAVTRYRGDLVSAQRYYEQALAIRERLAPVSLELAYSLHNLGNVATDRGDLDGAQGYYERALALFERLAPNSLEVASTLNGLGNVALSRGDLVSAQRYYEQALAIRERLAPVSLELAYSLHNLGNVALIRDDLDAAQGYYERALALFERLAPNSLEVAATLNGLGAVVHDRGDLALAQRYYEQALAIQERLAPNSLDVAHTLSKLGAVAHYRGDLALAQRRYEQALAIQERLAPNSLDVAHALNSLGIVVHDQGDLDSALRYYEQALAIRERLAPDSLDVASSLHNLGNVAADRGNLALAQRYYEQALRIHTRIAANSLGLANTLNSLGSVAYTQKNLVSAQRYYEQALAILRRLAPDSVLMAGVLHNLGNVACGQGNFASAQRFYEKALTLYNRLAPESLQVANTLNDLARLALSRNQPQKAFQLLQRAVAIVERQRQHIADTETRVLFSEQYFFPYALLALAHLRLKQPHHAVETLERSRARTLTESMHQRQLTFANVPKPLQELLQQQERLNERRLQTYRALRQTDPKDNETIAQHQRTLRMLDQQQRALDKQLHEQFPTYAELLIPKPLTLQQIQESLEPGTVLLYYALAEKELLIITVSRKSVQGHRVALKPKELEGTIRRFQAIVGKPPLGRTTKERQELLPLSRKLYSWLVKPAEASLRGARRALICPDGVLNLVPWSALVVSVNRKGQPVYWIEQVAIYLTPSMGVYRQARSVKPASQKVAVVAVSNYGGVELAQARSATATLLRRSGTGAKLANLPHVQVEVSRLQQLFGNQARALMDADATPEEARAFAEGARVLHFACHARADNVDPLGSVLLLAPAGKDEGLLTAADVLTGWRLRADLVMLSACETGMGVLRKYEGMFGLARAFLFAGCRSVGTSLWQVGDRSTAMLMGEFYTHYRKGVPKDEALRRAQLNLLRNARYDDPYYWAGFLLIGHHK